MPARAVQPATPRRVSKRRRVLLALLSLVALVLIGEFAALAGWWVVAGSLFTYGRGDAARELVLRETAAAATPRVPGSKASGNEVAMLVPHPFLGVSAQAQAGHLSLTEARNGMAQDQARAAGGWHERREGRYVLGIVGGGMAANIGRAGQRVLAAELQASEALEGREVEVLVWARKSAKQPEQLATLQHWLMVGGRLDGLVNLDGFEELVSAEENVAANAPAWYPTEWGGLVGSGVVRLAKARIDALQHERSVNARAWGRWRTSAMAQFYWLLLDRQLLDELAGQNDLVVGGQLAAGVRSGGVRPALLRATRRETARVWRRCSIQIHALCEAYGIDYFHFLQPSQYLRGSKPMSAAEQAIALDAEQSWGATVEQGYPLLLEEVGLLRRAGVRFEDLTMILQGDRAPYYTDSYCGLSRQGVQVVAGHVGAAMRRGLDLPDIEFRSVRVEPSEVAIDDPLRGVRLRVLGIDEAGQQHEITGRAFGTTIAASADRRVVVQPGGSVWAAQRGSSQVAVRNGHHVIHVPVQASWPDAHEGDDGQAAADGVAPRLAALGLPEREGTEQRVRCVDLPEAGLRLLALSAQPIPAGLPQDQFEERRIVVQRLPAGGTQAAATVHLPTAEDMLNRPLFARVLVLGANQQVMAASNTLVLTCR